MHEVRGFFSLNDLQISFLTSGVAVAVNAMNGTYKTTISIKMVKNDVLVMSLIFFKYLMFCHQTIQQTSSIDLY